MAEVEVPKSAFAAQGLLAVQELRIGTEDEVVLMPIELMPQHEMRLVRGEPVRDTEIRIPAMEIDERQEDDRDSDI